MEPGTVKTFKLDPGERAVVPLRWSGKSDKVTHCLTHPLAPLGLEVLPGEAPSKEYISAIVENTIQLPIVVTEQDWIAVGTEGAVPTKEQCDDTLARRAAFAAELDWKGRGADTYREVESPRADTRIIVVIHKVPRFSACSVEEVEAADAQWKGLKPLTRITTAVYEDGTLDYITDAAENNVEGDDFTHWH